MPANERQFEYLKDDGTTSSGALGTFPIYTFAVYYDYAINVQSNQSNPYLNGSPNWIVRSSSSVNDLTYIFGSPVTYSRVVEKNTSNGIANGKTVRYLTSFDGNPPTITYGFPFVPPTVQDWSYGLLTKELIYDQTDFLLKETQNIYGYSADNYFTDLTRLENFRSISIVPVDYIIPSGPPPNPSTGEYWTRITSPCYFKIQSFQPYPRRADLISSTTFNYSPNQQPVKTIRTMDYDPAYFYLKTDAITDSREIAVVNKFVYPPDMVTSNRDPQGIYQKMVDSNRVAPTVETQMFKGSVQTGLLRTDYQNPYPSVMVPKTVVTKIGNFGEQTRLRYSAYGDNGRVLSESKEASPAVNYIWSYNNQYPIAKIENADYATIVSVLGSTPIESFRKKLNPTNSEIVAFIAPLRANASLKDAQVTTYTYQPLAGVTTITDPKGMTTTYEYDNFQRLMNVKDKDGNIVKHVDYHYQGQ